MQTRPYGMNETGSARCTGRGQRTALVGVAGALVVGAWLVNGFANGFAYSLSEPSPRPKTEQYAESWDVEAVTICDLALKEQLLAPDSLDLAWSWQIIRHPEMGRATILREFSAQNVYGAQLGQRYRCLVEVGNTGPRILEINVLSRS
jgi:hypothetical protein